MLSNCGGREDSWAARKSTQYILKDNNPRLSIRRTDAEAVALILWPPDTKSRLIEKTLMLGKIEGKRKRGWQRMRWLVSVTDSMDMNFNKNWEVVEDRGACYAAVHQVTKSWTQLSD